MCSNVGYSCFVSVYLLLRLWLILKNSPEIEYIWYHSFAHLSGNIEDTYMKVAFQSDILSEKSDLILSLKLMGLHTKPNIQEAIMEANQTPACLISFNNTKVWSKGMQIFIQDIIFTVFRLCNLCSTLERRIQKYSEWHMEESNVTSHFENALLHGFI